MSTELLIITQTLPLSATVCISKFGALGLIVALKSLLLWVTASDNGHFCCHLKKRAWRESENSDWTFLATGFGVSPTLQMAPFHSLHVLHSINFPDHCPKWRPLKAIWSPYEPLCSVTISAYCWGRWELVWKPALPIILWWSPPSYPYCVYLDLCLNLTLVNHVIQVAETITTLHMPLEEHSFLLNVKSSGVSHKLCDEKPQHLPHHTQKQAFLVHPLVPTTTILIHY